MGSHPATALIAALVLGAGGVVAQEPGWHYSPLPGEGDRASLGCAPEASAGSHACLAVRCEDDFSIGIHVYASAATRPGNGDAPRWEITVDGETRILTSVAAPPYDGRLSDADGWLLDGLRQGSVVYLRPLTDIDGASAQINLNGSFAAIAEALQWCAPRLPRDEQNARPDVGRHNKQGEEE